MTENTEARGVCFRDVPGDHAADALGSAVADAAALGARLLQLPSVRSASDGLDGAELADAAALAAERGVALTASLPAAHPDRIAQTWGDDPASPRHPFAQLVAAERLGCEAVHVTVGVETDRLGGPESWRAQLERTAPVLRELVARASMPVVLKTHEEMTVGEVLRVADAVDGVRVGFSPVNVVVRLDDPLASAGLLAPVTHTVFLDDCDVVETGRGLARRMRRIGGGSLPWAQMLAAMPDASVVVDLHRASFEMPVDDAQWVRLQPGADVAAARARAVPDRGDDALGARLAAAHALFGAVRGA